MPLQRRKQTDRHTGRQDRGKDTVCISQRCPKMTNKASRAREKVVQQPYSLPQPPEGNPYGSHLGLLKPCVSILGHGGQVGHSLWAVLLTRFVVGRSGLTTPTLAHRQPPWSFSHLYPNTPSTVNSVGSLLQQSPQLSLRILA